MLHLVEHSKYLPWWIVFRPAAWDLATWHPDCSAWIVEVVWVVHPRLTYWARSHGLLPYAHHLGGFELVHHGGLTSLKAGRIAGRKTRWAWALLASGSC